MSKLKFTDYNEWFCGSPLPANPKNCNHKLFKVLEKLNIQYKKLKYAGFGLIPAMSGAEVIQFYFQTNTGKVKEILVRKDLVDLTKKTVKISKHYNEYFAAS
jgi:hypothetical protein